MEIAKCLSCRMPFDKKTHIPRILPQCGHSFCDSCIRKSSKASRRTFTCPIDKQIQVLWKQIEELPINKAIYDSLRPKQHSRSPSGHKYSFGSISNEQTIKTCAKHNKPLEFTCRYDNEEVCVDCLLFTNHKNHEFYRSAGQPEAGEVTKSPPKAKLNEPISSHIPLDRMAALTKQILEEPNSIQKALNLMKEQLKNQVTDVFKEYHQKLFKRQEIALKEIGKNLEKYESRLAPTKTRLHDYLKSSVKIQKKAQQIKRNSTSNTKQVDEIIKQINKFSDQIVEQDRKIQETVEHMTDDFRKQLIKNDYWKVLSDEENLVSAQKTNKAKSHSRKVSIAKSNKSQDENQSRLQIHSNYHKRSPQKSALSKRIHTQIESPKHSEMYGVERLNEYNPSCWRQSSPTKISPRTTRFHRSISSHNTSRQNSSEKHPELKYDNRCKMDEVVEMIRTQTPPNLELIDLEIKDYYIPSIVDAIKSSGKKIGVVKLVKNEITDEGFKMLLKGLRDYPYLHSLNLTSNLLTEECLQSILEFRLRNKTLTNFYLASNCISGSRCREKKRIMYEYGINLFL